MPIAAMLVVFGLPNTLKGNLGLCNSWPAFPDKAPERACTYLTLTRI